MKKVLVIDDDTFMCDLIVNHLKQNNFEAKGTYTGRNGIKLIEKNNFDIVLCDYRLPNTDGFKILQELKSKKPLLPVIIMTAYAEVRMAVKLIKSGAYDYITKPVQPEELLRIINKALESTDERETSNSFREKFITGNSKAIQGVMQHVKVVAPTDLTVLIEGETGSGKEYVAKAIHYASKRSKKPFVAVDCGAIPKDLANSELFGHIKGAFTGAINNKVGYFERAKGGTLFLDEVGNLSYENQVKLLRALQERFINKVGDNKVIKVDVRVITASNDDLLKLVDTNEFREDLYHRLNGFKIHLPPLRERGDDMLEFASFFIAQANRAFEKSVEGIDEDAKKLMFKYNWHGNIRELQNVVNRAVLLSKSNVIQADVLPDEIRFNNLQSGGRQNNYNGHRDVKELKEATLITEKEVITNALIESNYNKSKAAKILNIDRKTLYNKINQYDIDF
ncbi:sigma-54-dependent transcriptional regulator [Maribellus maritimus]|uniref:sigma-54-dependent transcriptional regulator n=1 Tax=Maribellus maritimus TaxID=2870838 RepID=UPI001EEAB04D|nr:sigma-54 dependent transcriptional regulator [Maribellus maritimus]MCG6187118.1 sigma-54 dependent transcriptional regulator [Maribellus maritimus]